MADSKEGPINDNALLALIVGLAGAHGAIAFRLYEGSVEGAPSWVTVSAAIIALVGLASGGLGIAAMVTRTRAVTARCAQVASVALLALMILWIVQMIGTLTPSSAGLV